MVPHDRGDQGRSTAAAPSSASSRPSRLTVVTISFVTATVGLLLAYAIGPGVEQRQVWYGVSHVLSAVAFTVGVFTSPRGFRQDWLIMLAAMYVWIVADVVSAFELDELGRPTSWLPGVMLSLVAYSLMTAGVLRLARRDGFVRGAAVGLDGAVHLIAVLLIWWLLLGQDVIPVQQSPLPGHIAAAAIPLGNGVLLAAASALSSSRTAHSLSSRALIVSAITGLTGDLSFARFAFGYEVVYPTVAALWMVQFAAAAVAALASSRPRERAQSTMPVPAIALVATALLSPLLLAVYAGAVPDDNLRVDRASVGVLFAGALSMAVLVTLRAATLLRHIERQAADLERSARTDELTQLPNRRAGDRILQQAIEDAQDDGTLSIALMDLDNFKCFNDTYGHQRGDQLLREAGTAWREVLVQGGALYRYGGEEFVVVLPGRDASQASTLLVELRRVTPSGQTFSAGVATLRPGEQAEALLGRADAALYEAKSTGRARTVEASSAPDGLRPA